MEKTIHLRLKIIFLFAAIFLVALSILSYIKIKDLLVTSDLVTQSNLVKLKVESILSDLTNMESSERGFILTKDSTFIESYFIASAELHRHLSEIDSLTRNNPVLQENVRLLKTLVDERVNYLIDILAALQGTPILAESYLSVRLLIGKNIMQEIGSQINKIQVEGERQLIEHLSLLRREIFLTPLLIVGLSIGSIIILVAAYFKILDETRTSQQMRYERDRGTLELQNILHHAPDAVITMDENGKIISWNPEAQTIFGWTESEVREKSLTDTIIPERYREWFIDGLNLFLKTGEKTILNEPKELYALKKDKSELPVELKISSSKTDDRTIFIGFVRNISKRKGIEKALENKAAQLVEAQNLAHIGSWEWDVKADKIEWSDELYRIYGFAPQEFEIEYEAFLKFTHPNDKEYVNGIVQQAFADHQPFDFTQRIVHRDGTIRILSATGKVFTDGQGNTIRMAGTAQDITKQKEYESELVRTREQFFKIFDSNPVAMTLTEIQTNKITHANTLFYSSFGYTPDEVIGHTSEEMKLLSPEESHRLGALILDILKEARTIDELRALSAIEREELLMRLKQSHAMKEFEVVYTRKNGKTFPALVSFENIGIGNTRYTITSYQDITQLKKAKKLLEKQNEELVKMNKELESFNYISSHDLQEPLRKIQVIASRLLETEHQNLSNTGKEYFNRLEKSAHRMQTLIRDLLAYSRANTAEGKFENTDLKAIVEEVKIEFNEIIKEKRATIEANDLGNCNVMRFQFLQLMTNLISNSLKFSKPEIAPHIIVKSKIVKGSDLDNDKLLPDANYCHLTISDNGIGFEPQYSEMVFEVFKRLHGKDKYIGTGIGLAIVKKIVENHHGIVTATSELNKGVTFDIYIPQDNDGKNLINTDPA